MTATETAFKFENGQEVYIGERGGRIVSRRVKNDVTEYLIKPTVKGMNFWQSEAEIVGRFFFVYDVSTDIQALPEVFYNVYDAIDAEEDFCYDMLEAGQEPPHLEVWEVNENGEKVQKVALS